jgi:hypothetical protein
MKRIKAFIRRHRARRETARLLKEGKTDVLYLCDGQREGCSKRTCYINGGPCRHTKDIRSAKNFEIDFQYGKIISYREKETAPEADAVGDGRGENKEAGTWDSFISEHKTETSCVS